MSEINYRINTISEYFATQSQLEQLILTILQNNQNVEENFDNLYNFMIEHKILQNKKDLLLVLKCLLSISNNHQRSEFFFSIYRKNFALY